MISADDLLFSFRWGADTLLKLVSDVEDRHMADQPVEGINHPAWLLGHVSIYNDVMAALLRGESFGDPWAAPCGKNSTPSPRRDDYPVKEEIVGRFSSGVETACGVIAGAPAAAWTAEMTHPTWGKQFATVAPAVTYLTTTHLGLHVGQLSGWRRAAGMPRV